jgi:hypothetical protein
VFALVLFHGDDLLGVRVIFRWNSSVLHGSESKKVFLGSHFFNNGNFDMSAALSNGVVLALKTNKLVLKIALMALHLHLSFKSLHLHEVFSLSADLSSICKSFK